MTEQKKNLKLTYIGAAVILVVLLAVGSLYVAPPKQVVTQTVTMMQTTPLAKIWLTYGDKSSTGKPDPAVGSDTPAYRLYPNLYDSLVEFDYSLPAKIIPSLATKWDVSSDGLAYTFYLKQGVKFHDGSELTAEAVKFSMDRMMTMKQGVSFMWEGRIKPGNTEVVDKYTVRIKLDKKFAPFLGTLPYFNIVNPEVIKAHTEKPGPYGDMGDYGGKWLNAGNDAGSGPYVLKNFRAEESFDLERFEGYWKGWKPNQIYGMHFKQIWEESTVRQLMESGECQITGSFRSTEFVKWADKFAGTKVTYSEKPLQPHYLTMNTKMAPLDDKWFRKGLSCLFDYDSFIKNIRGDIGDQRLIGPMPRSYWGHNSDIQPYPFDVAKAKEYFAKSKYSDLSKVRELTFSYINVIEYERLAGLLLQSKAAELGLKIKVESLPWAQYVDRISKPDTTPDIVAVTQAPFYAPDPDTVLYNMWHTTTAISWSRNPSYYDNPRVDELLDKARDIVDQEERAKLYKEVQAIVNDDAPVIFATEEVGLTPHSKQLSGVSWNVQYLHWLGLYGMWWEGTLPKGSIPAGFSLRSAVPALPCISVPALSCILVDSSSARRYEAA